MSGNLCLRAAYPRIIAAIEQTAPAHRKALMRPLADECCDDANVALRLGTPGNSSHRGRNDGPTSMDAHRLQLLTADPRATANIEALQIR
jgi:hypothetical protein